MIKLIFFTLFCLYPILSFSSDDSKTEAGICLGCEAKKNKGLEKLPISQCPLDVNLKDVKKMAEKEGAEKFQVVDSPSSRTSDSVTYKFPEITMKPGDVVYFGLPSDLQKKPVNFVVIGHRQDPKEEKGFDAAKKWDDIPGLSSFQVLTTNKKGEQEWRYWTGSSSGNQGAKFAEVRYSPEMENLYEWLDKGTANVITDERSMDPVMPEMMKVVNVGKDLVRLSEVTLKSQPDQFDQKIETIFTKGSSFNAKVAQKATLGGGQNNGGLFPDALQLGGYGAGTQPKLPEGWQLNGNTLSIPLPEGREISSVELLGGDSHPDGITNKDGGTGTPGWARLHMGIGTDPESADWFVKNENVPPEGLMLGSVSECGRKTRKGEKIFIRGTSDILYVMGLRIGLKK